MKKLLCTMAFAGLLATFSQQATAQNKRSCASFDHLQQQLKDHPEMAAERQALEAYTVQFAENERLHPSAAKNTGALYTIPVVVHVLYNTATQNISDAQINSQIDQLNKDYQLLNTDAANAPSVFIGLEANCQIQFCLAKQDANGVATTGIIRKSTTSTSFSADNDNAKSSTTGGDNAWPRDKYLNLWVVPEITSGGQPGILGYAQFPGGPAATDGVVIGYNYFGTSGTVSSPYNGGRTATHEIGHWFNLYHIWGDDNGACTGSDSTSDTPNQASENYGTPTFPHVSCSNGPNGDLFMDYMDYVDDAAMYMFTSGQKTRIQATLASGGGRFAITTSQGCTAPGTTTVCNVPSALTKTAITSTSVTLGWTANSTATSYTLQYKKSSATTFTTVTGITGTSYVLSGLTAGTAYTFQVMANCSSTSSSAYSSTATFTTTAAATCNAPSALTATAITTTSATLGWTANSTAVSYTLQYRASTATTFTSISGITTTSRTLTGLTAGTSYVFQVTAYCTTTSASGFTPLTTFTTTAACSDVYESNNTTATAATISANTAITAMIGTSTDKDYFKIVTTTAQPKLKLTLSNLPLDYDLQLLNSSGTQLSISQNGSTTNEVVTYNGTAAATYYAYVYGYNSNYSASQCYTLTTQTSASNFREEAPGLAKETGIILYPNPTTGDVNFNFYSPEAQNATVTVVDQSGRICQRLTLHLDEGQNTPKMSLGNLPAGLYFLHLQTAESAITAKLMLQH